MNPPTTDPSEQVHREVEQLTRRLRMPYIRKAAPEVLATARSQRWDPAEVLKSWEQAASSIPMPTQRALKTLEWVGRRENLAVCGPSGTGKSHYLEALSNHTVDRP